jgi:hypothetical protein
MKHINLICNVEDIPGQHLVFIPLFSGWNCQLLLLLETRNLITIDPALKKYKNSYRTLRASFMRVEQKISNDVIVSLRHVERHVSKSHQKFLILAQLLNSDAHYGR